jgi:hypothetical protein
MSLGLVKPIVKLEVVLNVSTELVNGTLGVQVRLHGFVLA